MKHDSDMMMTMSFNDASIDSGYQSQTDYLSRPRSPSSTPAGAGELGRDSRKLLDTINELASLGVEASNLPLPKIVVIGDQSSGKSSLIEAISEIKVPRDSGKCTSCVLKINLREANNSSWTLSLVQEYFYNPGRCQKGQQFADWPELRQPDRLAQISLEYHQVEEYLSRAQEALISPSMDQVAILNGQIEGDRKARFSPNVIELDVTGPSLPNLTLFDLPGIINQDPEDPKFPALVQKLAKSYIDSDHTIAVLAIPMNVDYENSTAASLIKKWGALDRTVGVLTKPDTLSEHDRLERWAAILEGKSFAVGKGYSVTKQPSPSELKHGISHVDARRNEASFFTNEPWCTHFSVHHQKFGSDALQAKLSSILALEIETCLPELRTTIETRLDGVLAEGQNYPLPPASPYGTVLRIMELLKADLDKTLLGDMPNSNDLIREWRGYTEDFHSDLKKHQPLIVVNTGAEAQWGKVINLDDSDDDMEDQHSSVVPVMTPSTGSKRAASAASSQESPTKKAKMRATPSSSGPSYASKYTLDQVKQRILDTTTSGVPTDTDPRAEDQMMKDALQHWNLPLRSYLSKVHDAIERQLLSTVGEHTAQWAKTGLPNAVEDGVRRCFDNIYGMHEQSCMRILRAEQSKPFTCNTDVLKFHREKQLGFLRQERDKARRRSYVAWDEQTTNKPPSEGSRREEKAKKVHEKDLKSDPHDPEIQVMGRVRGYFHLAAGTLADTIGKLSQSEVFGQLREHVPGALAQSLGLDGDDEACVSNCKKLLMEDAGREQKRQELTKQRERLEKGIQLLNNVSQLRRGALH